MVKSFFICFVLLLSPLIVVSEECSFAPTARITTTPVSGSSPDFIFRDGTEVVFSGVTSTANNCNGAITEYRWKIEGVYYYGSTKMYTFLALGANEHRKTYSVELRVRNNASPNLYNTKIITVTVKRPQRIYHLKDHLGNVRTSVDTEGNVVGYDDYYPFGLIMPGRSSNSANPNDNYKFIGEELDDEAGLTLMNLNARTYDPITGRFNQIDPLFDHPAQLGLSPYNYSWNNPINLSDPTGECPLCWAVAGAVWVGAEIGLAAYDIYDVVTTLSDKNATTTQKVVSVGGATAGMLLPGGGYSAADDVVEQVVKHGDEVVEQIAKHSDEVLGKLGDNTAVLGKVDDLKSPGALKEGESTLLDLLPNQGSFQANWDQNSGVLRTVMGRGKPIRDASVDPKTGALINNTGFLKAERNLLTDRGWTYDKTSRMWSPPVNN